jgi:hypothetical protein
MLRYWYWRRYSMNVNAPSLSGTMDVDEFMDFV